MKYEYEEIEDLARILNKVFIKVQPVEVEKQRFINVIIVSGELGQKVCFNSTVIEAPEGISKIEYDTITTDTYTAICNTLKDNNPKIEIIRGAIHE